MRRIALLSIALILSATLVSAQIAEPILGHWRTQDGRLMRVLGTPGALRVVDASDDDTASEGIAAGWAVTTAGNGQASLIRLETGESYLLPMADAILRVYLVADDLSTTLVNDRVDFPATPPGEQRTIRLRVKNEGTAPLDVNKLVLSGSGFKITAAFLVPRSFAIGAWADFWVQFSPTVAGEKQAQVQINSRIIQLVGSSVAQPVLEEQDGANWKAVVTTTPYDFGKVPRGESEERKFRIWLPDGVPAPLEPPSIEGVAFRVQTGGDGFSIFFEPIDPVNYTATLTIGAAKYQLKGAGTEIPPPRPILSPSTATLESGHQQSVSIAFSEAAKADATGTLLLEFTPESDALSQDASIAFLPGSSRSVSFSAKKGSANADFNGSSSIMMQTGSTAGWISLTANIGSYHETMKYHLAPAPVVFSDTRASKASSVLEVTVRGVDNLRTATAIGFTFYLQNGGVIGSGAMTADITQAFKSYYTANPQAAGAFLLRAQFPVSGDVSQLGSVGITMTNSAGTREVSRVPFQ
jgi:hypothetical protein